MKLILVLPDGIDFFYWKEENSFKCVGRGVFMSKTMPVSTFRKVLLTGCHLFKIFLIIFRPSQTISTKHIRFFFFNCLSE